MPLLYNYPYYTIVYLRITVYSKLIKQKHTLHLWLKYVQFCVENANAR